VALKKKVNICLLMPWLCPKPIPPVERLSQPPIIPPPATPPPLLPWYWHSDVWLDEEDIAELESLSSAIENAAGPISWQQLRVAEILHSNNLPDIAREVTDMLIVEASGDIDMSVLIQTFELRSDLFQRLNDPVRTMTNRRIAEFLSRPVSG
jgi:hypothetical protein